MSTSLQQRRQIIRTCKSRGWTIHPDVLRDLEEIGFEHVQATILPALANTKGRCITPALWKEFLEKQQEEEDDDEVVAADASHGQHNNTRTSGKVQVMSAFATPKLVYDEHRKLFRAVDAQQGHVLGSAQDKVDMLLQRYHWLHQRVLSHHLFRPTNLHERPHALTPVASLLGGNYAQHLVLLLAIVVRTSDTEFSLEDPTGQVAADWSECSEQDSLITEHSIILVEGTFHDQVFTVRQLRQPLHDEHNRLRIANLPTSAARLPLTAVVHGTSQFQRVLAKEHPDVLIVMLKSESELADVANFSDGSSTTTTIVSVPPANRAVWPIPPLSSGGATNPARIGGSAIVALNDTSIRQQWHAASLFRAASAQSWWRTAVDQGVMLPPTTPVYWNYMPRLYPIPGAFVVVDAANSSVVDEYMGCHILQLGGDEEEYGLYDEEEDGWIVCRL